jgi:hypothetical protein
MLYVHGLIFMILVEVPVLWGSVLVHEVSFLDIFQSLFFIFFTIFSTDVLLVLDSLLVITFDEVFEVVAFKLFATDTCSLEAS